MPKTLKKQELEDPLEVTVQSIIDYTVCGLYYDLEHIQNETRIIRWRDQMNEKFERVMKQVFQYYFFKKQAGQVPSLKVLTNKFEKLWFPKDMSAYEIAIDQHSVQHDTLVSFSSIAVLAIERFLENFGQEGAEALLIAEPYLIPVVDNVRLKGVIDLVLRYGNEYRVFKVGLRKRNKIHPFDFAAARMAFDHRNTGKPLSNVSYHYYDMEYGFVDVVQPERSDIRAIRFWCSEMFNSPMLVPRRGFTSYCRGCAFDEQCLKFTFPEPEKV